MKTRTTAMTVLAVLFGLLAFSNFMKPVAQIVAPAGPEGLVFFGHRLHGVANTIMAPLFGALLATYAYGIWTSKRWIVPLAVAYACYVPLNLVLFTALQATASASSSPMAMRLAAGTRFSINARDSSSKAGG